MYCDTTKALRWEKDGVAYTLCFDQDDSPLSPREEEDHMDRIFCWHRRYSLGDAHTFKTPHDFLLNLAEQFGVEQDAIEKKGLLQALESEVCILPVWMYDHSGISLYCAEKPEYPYNDPFDAGQVGYAYLTKQDAVQTLGASEENWKQRAEQYLKTSVKIYNAYITGEVYGFTLYAGSPPREIDSCLGFYGQDMEKNGIVDYVSCGLAEAIQNESYEWIDRPSKEELEKPDFTLKEIQDLMKTYGITLKAIPVQETRIYEVCQKSAHPEGAVVYLPEYHREMLVVKAPPRHAGKIKAKACVGTRLQISYCSSGYYDNMVDAVIDTAQRMKELIAAQGTD